LPDQKGKRTQHPTARWVFHCFVGIHVLDIPGQGLMILNLTDEPQHLLQLLGKRYAWFYRYKCIQIRPSVRNGGWKSHPGRPPIPTERTARWTVLQERNACSTDARSL